MGCRQGCVSSNDKSHRRDVLRKMNKTPVAGKCFFSSANRLSGKARHNERGGSRRELQSCCATGVPPEFYEICSQNARA